MNERIKKVLKESGLTQIKFAERIGISRTGLQKLISGENNPSEQTIQMICIKFCIDPVWLKNGEGEMKLPKPDDDNLVDRVMTGENEFAKNVMKAFAKLDDEEWEKLKALVDKLKKAGI